MKLYLFSTNSAVRHEAVPVSVCVDVVELACQLHASATLLLRMSPRMHCTGDWANLGARLDDVET
jgi:hypothetical protein